MIHPGIDVVGIRQDFMAGDTLYMGHKTHATGILLEGGVIETMFGGKPDFAVDSLVHHAFNSFGGAISNSQFTTPGKKQSLKAVQHRRLGLLGRLPTKAVLMHILSGAQTIPSKERKSRGGRGGAHFICR
jgi:hypothetical protein